MNVLLIVGLALIALRGLWSSAAPRSSWRYDQFWKRRKHGDREPTEQELKRTQITGSILMVAAIIMMIVLGSQGA